MKAPHLYADEFISATGIALTKDQRAKLIGRIAAAMEAERVATVKAALAGERMVICAECNDTGGYDGEPHCWACAKGCDGGYDGIYHHSSDRKRAAMGTRDEYVDRMVREHNLFDNREAA